MLAALEGVSVVVVGDRKTPKNWAHGNVTYLDLNAQRLLGFETTELLPLDSYARKAVGYLYAIKHGAEAIYETDDDNVLKSGLGALLPEATDDGELVLRPFRLSGLRAAPGSRHGVANAHAHFGQPSVWPRGVPLADVDAAVRQSLVAETPNRSRRCLVRQGLADADPDVDAIFRLTQSGEVGHLFFDDAPPVAVERGVFSPWNSQNTLVERGAFWALLLPTTVAFRVCDIWRGLWAQRLVWELGGNICFFEATVEQVRSGHDSFADYLDELQMHTSVGNLIDELRSWYESPCFCTCFSRLSVSVRHTHANTHTNTQTGNLR